MAEAPEIPVHESIQGCVFVTVPVFIAQELLVVAYDIVNITNQISAHASELKDVSWDEIGDALGDAAGSAIADFVEDMIDDAANTALILLLQSDLTKAIGPLATVYGTAANVAGMITIMMIGVKDFLAYFAVTKASETLLNSLMCQNKRIDELSKLIDQFLEVFEQFLPDKTLRAKYNLKYKKIMRSTARAADDLKELDALMREGVFRNGLMDSAKENIQEAVDLIFPMPEYFDPELEARIKHYEHNELTLPNDLAVYKATRNEFREQSGLKMDEDGKIDWAKTAAASATGLATKPFDKFTQEKFPALARKDEYASIPLSKVTVRNAIRAQVLPRASKIVMDSPDNPEYEKYTTGGPTEEEKLDRRAGGSGTKERVIYYFKKSQPLKFYNQLDTEEDISVHNCNNVINNVAAVQVSRRLVENNRVIGVEIEYDRGVAEVTPKAAYVRIKYDDNQFKRLWRMIVLMAELTVQIQKKLFQVQNMSEQVNTRLMNFYKVGSWMFTGNIGNIFSSVLIKVMQKPVELAKDMVVGSYENMLESYMEMTAAKGGLSNQGIEDLGVSDDFQGGGIGEAGASTVAFRSKLMLEGTKLMAAKTMLDGLSLTGIPTFLESTQEYKRAYLDVVRRLKSVGKKNIGTINYYFPAKVNGVAENVDSKTIQVAVTDPYEKDLGVTIFSLQEGEYFYLDGVPIVLVGGLDLVFEVKSIKHEEGSGIYVIVADFAMSDVYEVQDDGGLTGDINLRPLLSYKGLSLVYERENISYKGVDYINEFVEGLGRMIGVASSAATVQDKRGFNTFISQLYRSEESTFNKIKSENLRKTALIKSFYELPTPFEETFKQFEYIIELCKLFNFDKLAAALATGNIDELVDCFSGADPKFFFIQAAIECLITLVAYATTDEDRNFLQDIIDDLQGKFRDKLADANDETEEKAVDELNNQLQYIENEKENLNKTLEKLEKFATNIMGEFGKATANVTKIIAIGKTFADGDLTEILKLFTCRYDDDYEGVREARLKEVETAQEQIEKDGEKYIHSKNPSNPEPSPNLQKLAEGSVKDAKSAGNSIRKVANRVGEGINNKVKKL